MLMGDPIGSANGPRPLITPPSSTRWLAAMSRLGLAPACPAPVGPRWAARAGLAVAARLARGVQRRTLGYGQVGIGELGLPVDLAPEPVADGGHPAGPADQQELADLLADARVPFLGLGQRPGRDADGLIEQFGGHLLELLAGHGELCRRPGVAGDWRLGLGRGQVLLCLFRQ